MGVRGKSPFRDYILILIGASIMGFAIKNIYDPMPAPAASSSHWACAVLALSERILSSARRTSFSKNSLACLCG